MKITEIKNIIEKTLDEMEKNISDSNDDYSEKENMINEWQEKISIIENDKIR